VSTTTTPAGPVDHAKAKAAVAKLNAATADCANYTDVTGPAINAIRQQSLAENYAAAAIDAGKLLPAALVELEQARGDLATERAELADANRRRFEYEEGVSAQVEDLRDEIQRLRADIDALLPAAKLYLAALDADPEREHLTLPEAILVTALRDAVARHTDPAATSVPEVDR
jgi:hypothetical protein